jgi:large subunit ribosomal protein L35
MPKMKTHRATLKRVRLTGTGKIMRKQANNRHYFEGKSSKRKRRLSNDVVLAKSETRRVMKLIGRG